MQPSNPFVKVTISHYGHRSLQDGEKINDQEEIDISDCISSDFGAEVTYSRDDLSGIVVETSLPQKFTKKAYELLRSLFEQHGVYACAKLNIYRRDNIQVNDYHKLKTMQLDFASISINDRAKFIEIECTSTSINSYIKANGKTKYDIQVSELSPASFNYERIELMHTIDFNPLIPSSVECTPTGGNHCYILGITLGKYVGTSGSNILELKNCEEKSGDISTLNRTGSYFIKAKENVEVFVSLDFTVKASGISRGSGRDPARGTPSCHIYLLKRMFDSEGNVTTTYTSGFSTTNGILKTDNLSLTLLKGEELFFRFIASSNSISTALAEMTEFNQCRFSYQDKGNTITLDIVTPENLLNELVQEMTNKNKTYSTKIEWEGNEKSSYTPMLCAAESIRNLNDPYFHTSYSDFRDWMATLGYVPDYPDDFSLAFKKQDVFFPDDVILQLDEKENTDLIISVNPDFVYTNIKVGYEKQEYGENVNGRFEPNGTFEYSTGYISEEEKTLEIMSKYRVDPVGIELLAWERSEYGLMNKDTKSDNDVFVFALKMDNGKYSLYKDVVMKVGNITLFNAILNPFFIVRNNLKRIGIITKKVLFTSTTSSRSADFNNNYFMHDDIKCENGYFMPITYDIACGYKTSLPIIESPNGLVRFVNNGRVYTGYIKEATKNYSRDSETTIVLYAKS